MDALALCNKVIVEKLRFSTISTIVGATGLAKQVLWAINEIQRELAGAYDWNDLKKKTSITLATGTDLYSLASDLARIIPEPYYQLDDGTVDDVAKFVIVNDEYFLNHSAVDVTAGKPYIGREFGRDSSNIKQLQVYSIPTAAHNGTLLYYDYIKKLTDLSANADVSPFEDNWLIEGAYMKIKESQGRLKPENISDYINDIVLGIQKNVRRKRVLKYEDT